MKEKTYEGTKKTQNGLKRMFFSVLAILLQAVFMVYMFTRLNGLNGAPNKMRARFEEVDSMLLPCLPENADILSDMYEKVPQAKNFNIPGEANDDIIDRDPERWRTAAGCSTRMHLPLTCFKQS